LRTGDLPAVTVYDDRVQKAVTEEAGGRAQVLLHNEIKSALGLKLLEMKEQSKVDGDYNAKSFNNNVGAERREILARSD
jgi:hypothetical protein